MGWSTVSSERARAGGGAGGRIVLLPRYSAKCSTSTRSKHVEAKLCARWLPAACLLADWLDSGCLLRTVSRCHPLAVLRSRAGAGGVLTKAVGEVRRVAALLPPGNDVDALVNLALGG